MTKEITIDSFIALNNVVANMREASATNTNSSSFDNPILVLEQQHARSTADSLNSLQSPSFANKVQMQDDSGFTIHSQIAKLPTELPQEKEKTFATIRCKISGLSIARLPNLPWGAIPHELPFASYEWKAIHKFMRAALLPDSTLETKHFTLFSLLAKTPAEFTQLNARSSFCFYSLEDSVMSKVYDRGLQRLYNFTNFYDGLEPRYKTRFPKWRMGVVGAETSAIEDRFHVFSNFFSILNTWEQLATKFEYKGVKERGKKLVADSQKLLLEDSDRGEIADTENMYEAVQESIYKKMRDLDKNKIITIFDDRSIDRKKLPAVILILKDFYKLSAQEYKEFHYICYGAKLCGIARLEKLKGFIQDKAALEDDFPIEHTYFLNFLRWHIEAKKRVEQALTIVQEDQENNPIFVKLREAEEKQLEKLIASGMPKKEDFKSGMSYLTAVMNWKKNSGNGSAK